MFGSFGGMELVVIVLIVLLLFGAKKIPELARGIGQGINEFKKASGEIRKEIERGANESDELNKKNESTKTH
ncbi:twin-arginine translocase TatA/TatE family subunit [bacterium]|nr:MAG: twin-arginine translocase TatA/TatE family subunit [bacterium]